MDAQTERDENMDGGTDKETDDGIDRRSDEQTDEVEFIPGKDLCMGRNNSRRFMRGEEIILDKLYQGRNLY